MSVNYQLKVNQGGKEKLMGILTVDLSPNEIGTAVFTPAAGENSQKTLNPFQWPDFKFTLDKEIGTDFSPGQYTFGNRLVQDVHGIVDLPGTNQKAPWNATYNPATGSQFTITINKSTFGYLIVNGDLSANFWTPDGNSSNNQQWATGQFAWNSFTITLGAAYQNFAAGTYKFANGHFTKITGKVTHTGGPQDPPEDWTATSDVFNR